ncbi:unnamed protein product [Lactuca virosa]|uniref:F-box domain-containing protein n=1 Tax=Lactuca virosa TaxID=75947 RepID=A0AAU9LR07_9ASTR|nr:unnamed protein product [Lactuca virosa]
MIWCCFPLKNIRYSNPYLRQQEIRVHIPHLKTRTKMALGRSYSLGLVKRTSSFGRKRILILNEMDIDSIDTISPTKKRSMGNSFSASRSLLEALPQDILIRVLCGVDHDDLKRLFHVSKPIREAAIIAKKLHFEYNTPKKIPAFRSTIEPSSLEFDEIGAPRQLRVARSRLDRKKLASISVALFTSDAEDEVFSRRNL